ncbi:MAG TPA: ATP-binding cassette domain-containing protein [Steroidobacteraceae bacterium]|nr:ATP-binding cassette domain-containing protein [Steroidobacteraceae bacterium]
MSLITLLDAHLAYGDKPLLDGARFALQAGERVGLIGRNGTGKSTLLKVIAGALQLDDGELQRRDGLRIAFVEQEPGMPAAATLREGLLAQAAARGAYHGAASPSDDRDRWRLQSRLDEYLQRFDLDPERDPANSSGGEKKRAALALALTLEPELLLLDEPTNHLDIDGIATLEELLLKVPASIVITHDRAFLDRVTTRIVELDRGVLRSYPGNFATYESRKTEELAAEEVANRRFDKFWAQEEAWIRKGVEARRTRNEGRVKRLERLRVERAERRERLGNVKLSLDAGERSGKLVAELTDVTKRFGERLVLERVSARIMRGDRVGLIGANGAGKSTLIRVILGELPPDSGTVKLGTNLQIAYFDQLREQLDPDRSVAETISPGSDWVEIAGERKHVVTYLADFLFPTQRAKSPVKMLSGGERNRLLLARLFARPANFIVLDEPTNDLDIESLELLEQKLQEYPGTLLLVSHDRRFLDNVVTQTIAAEGGGRWREYVGGYTDWVAQRPKAVRASVSQPAAAPPVREKAKTKLSYKEQRELAALPEEIEALEREQSEINSRMSSADYHRQGGERIREDRKRLEEIESLLLAKFARWEALEELRGRLGA